MFDNDVYLIFEMMNDWGLFLLFIEMFKGYFFVNVINFN